MKPVIIILTIISLALGVGLLTQHGRASKQLQVVVDESVRHSNNWQEARVKLDELDKVSRNLESTLTQRTEALVATSNDLAKANAHLAEAGAEIAKVQTDLKTAQAEMQKQTGRITELEGQRDELAKRMEELTASIKSLESQIDDTKKKLASSEGDRKFLLSELKRMQDEKAVLVAQFDDLAALRAQVAKLREEAAINQRIAWMRAGVYNLRDKKGAERLLAGSALTAPTTDNHLNVEVEQNGASKVVPPSTPPKQ